MNGTPNNKPLPAWLETAWLDQYLSCSLSDEETEWFEAYMLDKPHLINEIEADTSLRDGLALSREETDISNVTNQEATLLKPSVGFDHRRWLPLAWAASIFVAWNVGWVFSEQPTEMQVELVSSPTRWVFDSMRGINSQPLIHPGDPESRYLLIEVGMPPDAEQIQLHIANKPSLPLVLSPDSFVSFLLPRERLDDSAQPRIKYVSAGSVHERVLSSLAE